MALAFGLVTLGTIMIYSGIKGLSMVEILAGETGEELSPKGGEGYTPGGMVAGIGGAVADALGGGNVPANASGAGFSGPKAKLLGHLSSTGVSKFNLKVTSTKRAGAASASWHNRGRAFDISGSASDMMAFAKWVKNGYLGQTEELFYDPLGGWDGGSSIGAIGGHVDHMHVAA